jgi:hypothetical protein
LGEYLVNLTPEHDLPDHAAKCADRGAGDVRPAEPVERTDCHEGYRDQHLQAGDPGVAIAAILAGGLFAFDQYYLPQANRKQEALRNIIKGKPAQTTLNPDQKWIFRTADAGRAGADFLLPVLRSPIRMRLPT